VTPFDALALMAAGAAAGSLPFGALLTRLVGRDVFTVGSKSMGAMNIYRNVSRPLGVAVLLLDAGKGALAVVLAGVMAAAGGLPGPEAAWWAAAGVPLGHGWSPWVGMRGGKGLAPAWGALTTMAWPLGLAGLAALIGWLLLLRDPTWGLRAFLLTFAPLTAAVTFRLTADASLAVTAFATSLLMAIAVAVKSRSGLGSY
jgi:glycerol-3-phosphate acyltransferase PlsY